MTGSNLAKTRPGGVRGRAFHRIRVWTWDLIWKRVYVQCQAQAWEQARIHVYVPVDRRIWDQVRSNVWDRLFEETNA